MSEEKDLKLRREFAKAFDWYEYNNNLGYSKKERVILEPTWEEVFIHIGKLIGAKTFYNHKDDVISLLDRVNNLELNNKENERQN